MAPPRRWPLQDLPHHYRVALSAAPQGDIELDSPGLATLASAPPAEFGGPGDRWSPETLLVASVVDCFALSFRAVAHASSLPWTALRCEAEGELARVERVTRFTGLVLRASLTIPPEADEERARRILGKAERNCLISNSLAFEVTLECDVSTNE